MTQRKRIMQEFEITEISAVDRPAQKHALMTIMKRMEPAPTPNTRFDFAKVAKGGAMAAVRATRENPDAFAKMQSAGEDAYQKHVADLHARPIEKSAAVAFTQLCTDFMKQNGGSRQDAMRAVRLANPSAFGKLQEV